MILWIKFKAVQNEQKIKILANSLKKRFSNFNEQKSKTSYKLKKCKKAIFFNLLNYLIQGFKPSDFFFKNCFVNIF